MKNITYIQLRAARQLLNIGVRELATILKVSKSTICKAEANNTRDFYHKYNAALLDYFKKNHIIFPTESSIRYDYKDNFQENTQTSETKIIFTRFQLKTARCILNITQLELANFTGINKSQISRAELLNNSETVKFSNINNINILKNFFINQNIEFVGPLFIVFKKYIDNGSIN